MSEHYLHLLISGRVQGVWFRRTTQDKARELGLRGWVRNLSDGRVELKAEGEADAVAQLRAWVEAGGPATAVKTYGNGSPWSALSLRLARFACPGRASGGRTATLARAA